MTKNQLTNEIRVDILAEKEKGTPGRQAYRELKKKYSTLTLHNVQDVYKGLEYEIRDLKDSIEELSDTLKEEQHYEVTEDHYIFHQKRPSAETGEIEINKFPILISTVDNIFKDFSKHGNNLSSEEILQKYQIKPELFQIIKNRLRLFKASHIVSPVTLDRASDEDLQNIIENGIDEHIKDRYRDRFTKTFEKKQKEDYIRKSKILSNYDYLLEHLQSFLQNHKPRDIEIISPTNKNTDSILACIADIHLGKKRTALVRERIYKITTDLINRPEQNVVIYFAGDNMETLARGGMHKGQVESMDGPFEFDLLMQCVEEIETMLISLYKAGKTVEVFGIGGNHTRFTQNKEDGMNGLGDLLVYEMVSRSVKQIGISVNILRDTWNTFDFDGMHIIANHGDDNASQKKPSQILWEKGKQGVPNVILFGDKHHYEQFDSNSDSTKILIPSIAGSNEYDERKLLASYPGYVIITKDPEDNVPCTYTRRFKMG